MKVLANDGISESGAETLRKAGFEVIIKKVAQEQLKDFLNKNGISVLLVRSATKVGKDIIDNCIHLKVIGRGGVGMDNIEVKYARSKGIAVINTPAASSSSVAELVFAHLFGGVRHLHDSNRNMPLEGDSRFKELKKSYAGGMELRGKTLGIIGFGRIGREVAKIALGIGMKVIASDQHVGEAEITLEFYNDQTIKIPIKTEPVEMLIKDSDFITLHVPAQAKPIIGTKEFEQMKEGVGIINTARGGVLDEEALLAAIESGKVAFAALDTYENEPTPAIKLLMNESISLSPHIGAATNEAQERIGVELAEQIIDILKKKKSAAQDS
ncbi:D-3-phosphoglycerate dehydrogenase [Christiangramia gaetbulicola]|uniref:D-3-phosphoglycerate dehydrogenase n=1 Tax=Christiangramia gaetbulicola TaxID=703340 RepID=A0A2T6AHE2_9FLAO|nr:D-2-hydroxyacid dehydrogenase [Christiangramia gaetbulicola]PTX43225.1 D-3-phosphoglycerate dehydrogenase [Christiangramia gaetbulicola]